MSFEGEHASHKIFCGLLLSTYQTQGIEIQRLTKKGLYVVARILFLPLLNCSAWPCLGPVYTRFTYLFVPLCTVQSKLSLNAIHHPSDSNAPWFT